jgi:hypothetical protein
MNAPGMDEPDPVETDETADHADSSILYVVKGQKFVDEATLSAQRAKTVMPDCPITIVTDRDVDAECFDQTIIDADAFTKSDKPRLMQKTPYDRTIFVDTDTYLAESIVKRYLSDIFTIETGPGNRVYLVRHSGRDRNATFAVGDKEHRSIKASGWQSVIPLSLYPSGSRYPVLRDMSIASVSSDVSIGSTSSSR